MHRSSATIASAMAGVCLLAAAATAQVTDIRVIARPAPADVLPGYIVNDISIDFTGQYTGSQLYLELVSGELYQHPAGGSTAPNSVVAGVVPGLRWDTYVTQGGEFSDTSNGAPALGGGAVNLQNFSEHPNNLGRPISSAAVFSPQVLNQQFNPAAGHVIVDQRNFMVARITLSNDDAHGQIVFAGFASPDASNPVNPNSAIRMNLPIINGVIGGVLIPEPLTIALAGIGLLFGLVAMKRRNR